MVEKIRNIIFYKTESGKCPIEEFLDSLTPKEAQKVTWVLKIIEELPVVPKQYLKKLVNTDDIWEIRVSIGGNIFRLFGFFEDDNLIVLTNAIQKKTQKLPQTVIKIAERRKKECLQRRLKYE